MCIIEPENYQEAAKDIAWQEAMNAELEMIDKNKTWELVNRLADKPVIVVKWVYKTRSTWMEQFKNSRLGLWLKGMHRSLVLITMRDLHQWQG